MLETRAIVVQKDSQFTLVEASGAGGCSVCEGKGCGSSKVGQLFCSKPRQFKVENHVNAEVGDEVIVSIVEGTVLRGISLFYLLPLALMFAGAVLGGGWIAGEQRDGYATLGALSGLLIGFLLAKRIFSNKSNHQPFIARLIRE